ncbi:4Fe-4S binding protein [Hydrogenimonas thermophila]|uniref:4Fe-4S binding protein n=1 Tax=Hydrogenimonas thermophila TaxID=223786 RepID=UPI002936E095|nr:4Fe-4S binding protein [Hydrogenimonas thermophila]WOE70564.1 4Fe-4S binding protein [Hydrogenimonas thermophila]WOE73080.1 4Fe-4S binding protein [Hydrogenimonas thermophila]
MVNFIKRDGNDLFKNRFFRFIFKNKKFVFTLRILVAFLFFYAIFMGFYNSSKENIFTTALFWGIFWPLFIVTTLPTFGRIFCGICPHGFLGRYITKIGLKKSMPKWMQNRFIGVMLLFLGWWGVYYIFPGVYRTPLGTATLFLVMTIVAFIIYYLYKDMSYCKYICPIGTALRGYSKLSFTKLGSYSKACSECKTFDCAKSCPYGLSPFNFNKKSSMNDCTLCMECSHSCEAIGFKFVKPGNAIYKKFKTLKAEVWVFILILAAIPISMAFHHGLGRSNISDQMIWVKTAEFFKGFINFGSIDPVGLFAFLYATLFTVASAVIGMWIASKILKKDFNTVFYTLGYAFAPLFILASMAHALEFFFTSNSARIVEGFAWGFGMDVDVDPLAKRGDKWLMFFHMFRWIAVIWAFYILYKRMAYIDAPKKRKILAYPFASLLIIFFIGVNLYRNYVIDTYGRKAHHRGGMHNSRSVGMVPGQNIEIPKIKVSIKDIVWFTDRLPVKNPKASMKSMGHRRGNLYLKKLYLVSGTLQQPACVANVKGTFYTVDSNNSLKRVKPKYNGCATVELKMSENGYYKAYYLQKEKRYIRIAKYEYKHFRHGSNRESLNKLKPETVTEIPFDIIRLKSKDEKPHYREQSGDKITFKVVKDGKPIKGAEVTITTELGWQKHLVTGSDGTVSFRHIKDHFDNGKRVNRYFRENYIIAAYYKSSDGTEYVITQTSQFMPSRSEYQSKGYALVIAIILLIALVGGVAIYRYRTHKPFKEVILDE